MRNLTELNINERGRPVGRSAPNETIIKAFESHFGIRLPTDFTALLRHSNGGHPELDSFKPIGRPGVASWAVNQFYRLDDDKSSSSNLWTATEKWQPILGKNALPFASDAGGSQFFLDLATNPPVVKGCLHDENFQVVDLAPSFEAFINGLESDPEMI
jgi:hypothetical protein